ncbi:uncharacterized protein H6S33_000253 [Morchella sextelata]|jgi:hypothetical protein|uniref:uncharacterized protein n=1 Tax=Morchella sextelata TaxID=1174677 RepID=UPI001D04815C|nr:uncharacterized protein H6S33_000253 [Morchella sextelata]KAH0614617.1 hypothetical protein H6S33_000253 [Morchella sextelata]
MPNSTQFKTLPGDILIHIFLILPNYSDLANLALTSKNLYHLFKSYESSILTQITINIVDIPSWQYIKKILVYQRAGENILSHRDAIKHDLGTKLVFTPSDAKLLMRNLRYYESCRKTIKAAICRRLSVVYFAATKYTHRNKGTVPRYDCDGTLPMDDFYRAFLWSYEFSFDTIQEFAERPELELAIRANLCLILQVMGLDEVYKGGFGESCDLSIWPGAVGANMTNAVEGMKETLVESEVKNPLLLAKINRHYSFNPRYSDNEERLALHLAEIRKQYIACSKSGVGMDAFLKKCQKEVIPFNSA